MKKNDAKAIRIGVVVVSPLGAAGAGAGVVLLISLTLALGRCQVHRSMSGRLLLR